MKYIKPKVGDKVICIDDDSQDEDFGMSGAVLKGTKGLIVGQQYTIKSVDFSNVPDRIRHGVATWTVEEYKGIKWYWTMCWIEGNGFHDRMFLGKFKRT